MCVACKCSLKSACSALWFSFIWCLMTPCRIQLIHSLGLFQMPDLKSLCLFWLSPFSLSFFGPGWPSAGEAREALSILPVSQGWFLGRVWPRLNNEGQRLWFGSRSPGLGSQFSFLLAIFSRTCWYVVHTLVSSCAELGNIYRALLSAL